MKVAILAGGSGSRLAEETATRPKPLVEIGGLPIVQHILDRYVSFGFDDFVIATGHRGDLIKSHFNQSPNVEVVDTGLSTASGGRIKRLAAQLGNRPFQLTWCDGLADLDLRELVEFHQRHGKLATVTVVHPPSRFGYVELQSDQVTDFREKPVREQEWINAAYFVLEPAVLDYIAGDHIAWEQEPLQALARDGQLMAYRHEGFWQCMDTVHERDLLEELWQSGNPPWVHRRS